MKEKREEIKKDLVQWLYGCCASLNKSCYTRLKTKTMKLKGKISILIGSELTRIQVTDALSGIQFLEIQLTPAELSEALSRIAHTPCQIKTIGLDKVGKIHEHKKFEFMLPYRMVKDAKNRDDILWEYAQKLLDKEGQGWEADSYFGSKDSFFQQSGKDYARCTIRRWLPTEPETATSDKDKIDTATAPK